MWGLVVQAKKCSLTKYNKAIYTPFRCVYPIYVGICFSEKAYLHEMKRLGVKDYNAWITNDAGATCHTLTKASLHTFLICIDGKDAVKKRNKVEVYGLIVHEVTHVLQGLLEYINERQPGHEMEAYFMQTMSQYFFQVYNEYCLAYRNTENKKK